MNCLCDEVFWENRYFSLLIFFFLFCIIMFFLFLFLFEDNNFSNLFFLFSITGVLSFFYINNCNNLLVSEINKN
jgi:hypothetical protein